MTADRQMADPLCTVSALRLTQLMTDGIMPAHIRPARVFVQLARRWASPDRIPRATERPLESTGAPSVLCYGVPPRGHVPQGVEQRT